MTRTRPRAALTLGRPCTLDPPRAQGLDEWRLAKDAFVPLSKQVGAGKFTDDDLDFQGKILMRCAGCVCVCEREKKIVCVCVKGEVHT